MCVSVEPLRLLERLPGFVVAVVVALLGAALLCCCVMRWAALGTSRCVGCMCVMQIFVCAVVDVTTRKGVQFECCLGVDDLLWHDVSKLIGGISGCMCMYGRSVQ